MMAEWGIPFDHIENNWTDAQFALMAKMLGERLNKQRAASSGKKTMKLSEFMHKQGIG